MINHPKIDGKKIKTITFYNGSGAICKVENSIYHWSYDKSWVQREVDHFILGDVKRANKFNEQRTDNFYVSAGKDWSKDPIIDLFIYVYSYSVGHDVETKRSDTQIEKYKMYYLNNVQFKVREQYGELLPETFNNLTVGEFLRHERTEKGKMIQAMADRLEMDGIELEENAIVKLLELYTLERKTPDEGVTYIVTNYQRGEDRYSNDGEANGEVFQVSRERAGELLRSKMCTTNQNMNTETMIYLRPRQDFARKYGNYWELIESGEVQDC